MDADETDEASDSKIGLVVGGVLMFLAVAIVSFRLLLAVFEWLLIPDSRPNRGIPSWEHVGEGVAALGLSFVGALTIAAITTTFLVRRETNRGSPTTPPRGP